MIDKSADPAGDDRQERVIRFCGQYRYANYLEQEDDDPARAIRLAHWNTMAAGVMHEQLGYVEIAVRNAIDRELCDWNMRKNGSPDWTDSHPLPDPINKLIAKQIKDARSKLKNPSHGAVVDRLMWGTWVKLVGSADPNAKTGYQERLWEEALYKAFTPSPDAGQGHHEQDRTRVAKMLEYLRINRNLEAHFMDLRNLPKEKEGIIQTSLQLLSAIDPSCEHGWFSPSAIRRIVSMRP